MDKFKRNLKYIIKYLITVLIVGIILGLGLKHLIVHGVRLTEVSIYQRITDENETITYFILPDNYCILRREMDDLMVFFVFKLYLTKPTRYIGNVFNISDFSLLGVRYYPNADNVLKVNAELIEVCGDFNPGAAPKTGTNSKQIWIFSGDFLSINYDKFERIKITDTHRDFINSNTKYFDYEK
jgi:hypothetical protein